MKSNKVAVDGMILCIVLIKRSVLYLLQFPNLYVDYNLRN
jgi:hypothetical protein